MSKTAVVIVPTRISPLVFPPELKLYPPPCQLESINPSIAVAIPGKRARRKSMSRRRGQLGSIEKCIARNEYRARFRIDVEGQEKRMF